MFKKEYLLLLLVVGLAFLLRFYRIESIPPALNWDEVSIGYNAYSVFMTGRDEWGELLPVHFRAYGEYKLPVQIYFSIPAIAIFGLNELGVRITPVIYGSLTVLLLFFLARKMFGNSWVALLSALLLAISPWHIQLTRASFESSFAVFWLTLVTWLLIKGMTEKRYWLVLSMIPFAISVYTYNSARVFTPLYLFGLAMVYRKSSLKSVRSMVLAVALFAVLLLPLVPYYLNGQGSSRYRLVSITDDAGLIPRINEQRGLSTLPEPLPRLIHNKITYLSFYTIQNYLAHLSPEFLFISGAPHKQHHVQGIGQLYLFQAPFLLLGLYWLFKIKQPWRWLLVSWILLGLIPVSVTQDSIPHALRTLIIIIPLQLISALGLYQGWLMLRDKSIMLARIGAGITAVIMLVSITIYINNIFNVYPQLYSRDWQYGYQQVVEYVNEHYAEYDQIVFTRAYGEPHLFTLFFSKFDPDRYQNDQNLVRYQAFDWVWVLRFDKYYFPNLSDKGTRFLDLNAQLKGRVLYIGKKEDFPDDYPRLKQVNFLDGTPAFDVVETR